jgi:hypothetical protein
MSICGNVLRFAVFMEWQVPQAARVTSTLSFALSKSLVCAAPGPWQDSQETPLSVWGELFAWQSMHGCFPSNFG